MKFSRRSTILLIAASLIIAGGITSYIFYRNATTKYTGESIRLYIDAKQGMNGFRDSLQTTLGEDFGAKVYDMWTKMVQDSSVYTASYIINTGEEAWKVAKKIRNRQQDPVRVTFNNIRTLDQLAERVANQLYLSSTEFLETTDAKLSEAGINKANYVAHFLPDTYEFYWSATPEQVVTKLTKQYTDFWNEERLKKAERLNLTPEQVTSLAAIVEEETNMSDERPKVARLYLNRLEIGMPLQADPTVKYAVGDFTLRRITAAHLAKESPYNTYRHTGLTPGPIRIPTAKTLDAVLNAPKHNYLYMCAKEDFSGYHNFARDLATHNANARRYHQALNARGIN